MDHYKLGQNQILTPQEQKIIDNLLGPSGSIDMDLFEVSEEPDNSIALLVERVRVVMSAEENQSMLINYVVEAAEELLSHQELIDLCESAPDPENDDRKFLNFNLLFRGFIREAVLPPIVQMARLGHDTELASALRGRADDWIDANVVIVNSSHVLLVAEIRRVIRETYAQDPNRYSNTDQTDSTDLPFTSDRWTELFASLRTIAKANLESSNIATAHNYYAAYTYLLLSVATGRRGEDNPLWQKSDYCQISNQWFVDDNPPEDQSNPRIVVLPSMAAEQIRAYDAHLEGLVAKVGKRNPKLLKSVADSLASHVDGYPEVPYLFLLRHQDLSPYAPSSDDFCDLCEDLIEIELDHHRTFLDQELNKYGVDDHLRELMLGHWFKPQFPQFSGHSKADLKKVSTFVEKMMWGLKVSPLRGYSA